MAEFSPDYNSSNYFANRAGVTRFSSGPQGDKVRFFNVTVDHLDTLGNAVDALKNGDIKRFNQINQRIKEETGQLAPTDFDGVKKIVANEIVKAVSGANGALGDREEVSNTLSRANSPQQLQGLVKRYQQLIVGQLKGLETEYNAIPGPKDPFDLKLNARSKQIYQEMKNQNAPNATGNAGTRIPVSAGGKTYYFPSQDAADQFKEKAGIQ